SCTHVSATDDSYTFSLPDALPNSGTTARASTAARTSDSGAIRASPSGSSGDRCSSTTGAARRSGAASPILAPAAAGRLVLLRPAARGNGPLPTGSRGGVSPSPGPQGGAGWRTASASPRSGRGPTGPLCSGTAPD